MLKKLLPICFMILLALSITACQPPKSTGGKGRPDTIGSATRMMMGHRPEKKKPVNPDDAAKKMVGIAVLVSIGGCLIMINRTSKETPIR